MHRLPRAENPAASARSCHAERGAASSWIFAGRVNFSNPSGLFAAPRVTGSGLWSKLGLLFTLTLTFPLTLPAAEASEPAVLASRSLLLDAARAGQRLVAVGDRGHVLLSDDEGTTWRQVIVPTRAMLTGVAFGDARHGWASGHDGVILATTDGGQSWLKQVSGGDLETVFLDTHFRDSGNGFVIGAYGQCLRTIDGGKTWTPVRPTEDEAHFNQIAAGADGTLYLAGESGTLLASGDQGAIWRRLEVPYDGSLFGLLPLDARTLLAYGLRGHVFLSADSGKTWARRDSGVSVLLMAGVRLKSGVIVLAGLGGNFGVSRDGGATFTAWKPAEYIGGVSALLEAGDGALVVVGEKGVARLTLP